MAKKWSEAYASNPVTTIQNADLVAVAVSDGSGGYVPSFNAAQWQTVKTYTNTTPTIVAPEVVQDPNGGNAGGTAPANAQVVVLGAYSSGSVDNLYSAVFMSPDRNRARGPFVGSRRDASGNVTLVGGNWVGGTAGYNFEAYPSSGNPAATFWRWFCPSGTVTLTNGGAISGFTSLSTTALTVNSFSYAPGGNFATGGAVTFSGAFSFTGTLTGNTSVTFPTSGTLTTTSNNLSVFASTTSAQLAGVISDETGSGSLVFANTPTLVTPVLGVATATSINRVAITQPATAATLTIANNGSLITSGAFAITLTCTAATNVTLPTSGTLTTLATVTSTANTFTAAQAGAFVALTDAATVAINSALGNNFNLVTTSAVGATRQLGVPTNMVAGRSGVITVRQDISGSRALTYAWPYVFPGGSPPALSTAALAMDQLNYMINFFATATVTITIATPAVVTWTAHGLASGQRIQLTTTGALPTGLSPNTTYWVTVVDANSFRLSTSLANAQAAVFIATSGTQSGVHTATSASITITMNQGLA